VHFSGRSRGTKKKSEQGSIIEGHGACDQEAGEGRKEGDLVQKLLKDAWTATIGGKGGGRAPIIHSGIAGSHGVEDKHTPLGKESRLLPAT